MIKSAAEPGCVCVGLRVSARVSQPRSDEWLAALLMTRPDERGGGAKICTTDTDVTKGMTIIRLGLHRMGNIADIRC